MKNANDKLVICEKQTTTYYLKKPVTHYNAQSSFWQTSCSLKKKNEILTKCTIKNPAGFPSPFSATSTVQRGQITHLLSSVPDHVDSAQPHTYLYNISVLTGKPAKKMDNRLLSHHWLIASR